MINKTLFKLLYSIKPQDEISAAAPINKEAKDFIYL